MIYLLPILLLAGCASYTSAIRVGDVRLELPKDAAFDSLQFSRTTTSNGASHTVTLTVVKGVFKMNPAVMDAKTRHDVELFRAGAGTAVEWLKAAP